MIFKVGDRVVLISRGSAKYLLKSGLVITAEEYNKAHPEEDFLPLRYHAPPYVIVAYQEGDMAIWEEDSLELEDIYKSPLYRALK